MCGENVNGEGLSPLPLGSPPRVRGKRFPRATNHANLRITPACAGKTLPAVFFISRREDHPRVCGENERVCDMAEGIVGSPPRVRGKRIPALEGHILPGITPACAGKTRN